MNFVCLCMFAPSRYNFEPPAGAQRQKVHKASLQHTQLTRKSPNLLASSSYCEINSPFFTFTMAAASMSIRVRYQCMARSQQHTL